MHNPLSERCFKALDHNGFPSDYASILKTMFIDKDFIGADVDLLMDRLISQSIHASVNLKDQLKELASLILMKGFGQKLRSSRKIQLNHFLKRLVNHPDAFDDSLIQSYFLLLFALIDEPYEGYLIAPLPSGFVTHGIKEVSTFGEQIILQNQVEIAINLLIVALIKQDQSLVKQASKMISAFAGCFDEKGDLLVGLWSPSCIKDKNPFLALTFLAVYTYNQISNHPILKNALAVQSEVISNLTDFEVGSIGNYALVLSFALDQILNQNLHELVHDIKFSGELEPVFEDVGLIVDKLGNFSTYLTLSGINHSIGSILTQDVKILAMGPHFFPLGDLSKFGTFFTIDKDRIIPVSYEKNDQRTIIKGMTKIIHSESNKSEIKPSDTWLELELMNEFNRLKMTISLMGEPCKLPLSFAFFVKSHDTEMIGNQQVKPKSMDKYVGPSQKVVFKGPSKNFTILPCFEEKMHLIPLQGKNHFWGADYLLACEISQFQKKYSWEFQ